MKKRRVIIDTDPATGIPFRDVDDGLAILLLLASPEIHVEGVTVNFGNVKADLGYTVGKEVLEIANSQAPIFKGASSKMDIGKMNPAVEFMLETVRKNPGEISLLALAPLTNVATAMMLDGEFAQNLRELVIMGGTFNFGIFSFFGEFNFHCDGPAASLVIGNPVSKTLITMDTCSQAVFQHRHLDRLREIDNPVTVYLREKIPLWLNINKRVFFRKKGFFPWDPVAASWLLDESLFDSRPFLIDTVKSGICAGHFKDIRELNSFQPVNGFVPVNIPGNLKGDAFMELMLGRFLSYKV